MFTLGNGYLTFTPDLIVDSGTLKLQPWEVVALGEKLASVHNLPLENYFEIQNVTRIVSQEISLGYLASNDFRSLYDACVLFNAGINKALYEARHMNNLRLDGPYDVLI